MKPNNIQADRTSETGQRGVTLIELLISMALSMVLVVAAVQFVSRQVEVHGVLNQMAGMQQAGRAGVEIMLGEIKMAGYDPVFEAGAGVMEASLDAMRVSMDLNADGDVQDEDEDVAYHVSDLDQDGKNDLVRTVSQLNSEIVVRDVSQLIFIYTLEDGTRTSTPPSPEEIRSVEFHLEAAASGKFDQHWSLGGATLLRNRVLAENN